MSQRLVIWRKNIVGPEKSFSLFYIVQIFETEFFLKLDTLICLLREKTIWKRNMGLRDREWVVKFDNFYLNFAKDFFLHLLIQVFLEISIV